MAIWDEVIADLAEQVTALEYAISKVAEEGTALPPHLVEQVFTRVCGPDLEPSYWDIVSAVKEIDPGADAGAYQRAMEILSGITEATREPLPPHASIEERVRSAVRLSHSGMHGGWGLCPHWSQPDSRDDACWVCWHLRYLAGEEIPTI